MNYDNATYCFLDTETTSADPDRGVVEVGWILTDGDFNIVEQVESLIDPQMLVSPAASGVHGLVNADVENSPTLEEFFTLDDPACHGRKLPGNLVVLGHRVSFDTHTVGPYIDGEYVEACSLRWARRLYPSAEDHKLSTLIFALGLPRSEGVHRVLADVMSTLHLTKHLCERAGLTLRQYAEASAEPFLISRMGFGKHKGELMTDVPRSYLSWMQRSMDLDPDLAHTIKTILRK